MRFTEKAIKIFLNYGRERGEHARNPEAVPGLQGGRLSQLNALYLFNQILFYGVR
jgi:hypothetical protein